MAIVRTVNRLIRAVLSDALHVYHPAQAIEAEDERTVKEAIQDRLAAWTGTITIPVVITESFAMIAGTASYTVGQTGSPSLNTTRPDHIIGAYIRSSGNDDPVGIITESQYRGISDKTISGQPTRAFPDYKTPNITIYLHPVPDSTDSFYIASIKPYTEPTVLTADTFVDLGIPGPVYNALKWRVAIDVAPAFRAELHPSVTGNATDSYADMMALNLARTMTPVASDLSYSGSGRMSLNDFLSGG